jgi:hypothetical protein
VNSPGRTFVVAISLAAAAGIVAPASVGAVPPGSSIVAELHNGVVNTAAGTCVNGAPRWLFKLHESNDLNVAGTFTAKKQVGAAVFVGWVALQNIPVCVTSVSVPPLLGSLRLSTGALEPGAVPTYASILRVGEGGCVQGQVSALSLTSVGLVSIATLTSSFAIGAGDPNNCVAPFTGSGTVNAHALLRVCSEAVSGVCGNSNSIYSYYVAGVIVA